MQYQHTNTSHNRTGLSTLAEIAGGAGLRSPQPQQLASTSCLLRSDRTAYGTRTLTRRLHGARANPSVSPLLTRGSTHPWSFERGTVGR